MSEPETTVLITSAALTERNTDLMILAIGLVQRSTEPARERHPDIYANRNGSGVNARDWQNANIQWLPLGGTLENIDGKPLLRKSRDGVLAPERPYVRLPLLT